MRILEFLFGRRQPAAASAGIAKERLQIVLSHERASRDAPGEYYSSAVPADGNVFLASSEGKITGLKGGGKVSPRAPGRLIRLR